MLLRICSRIQIHRHFTLLHLFFLHFKHLVQLCAIIRINIKVVIALCRIAANHIAVCLGICTKSVLLCRTFVKRTVRHCMATRCQCFPAAQKETVTLILAQSIHNAVEFAFECFRFQRSLVIIPACIKFLAASAHIATQMPNTSRIFLHTFFLCIAVIPLVRFHCSNRHVHLSFLPFLISVPFFHFSFAGYSKLLPNGWHILRILYRCLNRRLIVYVQF